jgi:hypothetical protein
LDLYSWIRELPTGLIPGSPVKYVPGRYVLDTPYQKDFIVFLSSVVDNSFANVWPNIWSSLIGDSNNSLIYIS